jgi:hypothetical protein
VVLLIDAQHNDDSATADSNVLLAQRILREAGKAADKERPDGKQRLWKAWISQRRAQADRLARRYDRSRSTALRAVEEFDAMRHRYGAARCWLEIAKCYLEEHDPGNALRILEDARQTFAYCGDRWTEAETALMLAETQLRMNRFAEAVQEAYEASEIYGDLGDHGNAAKAREAMAQAQALARRGRRAAEPGQVAALGGLWSKPPLLHRERPIEA